VDWWQVEFKYVDDLATVWCEWAELELRHKNFKRALDLMRRATYTPDVVNRRAVSARAFCDAHAWNLELSWCLSSLTGLVFFACGRCRSVRHSKVIHLQCIQILINRHSHHAPGAVYTCCFSRCCLWAAPSAY
jgi:hypothetical protein